MRVLRVETLLGMGCKGFEALVVVTEMVGRVLEVSGSSLRMEGMSGSSGIMP